MANDTSTQTSSDDSHVGHAAHSAHAVTSISEALNLADAFCLRQGEKLTPIRRKVLELLLTSGRATKAYTLLDEMRKIHPGSAPPTVYRALDFLLSLGLVHRVESINAFAACHDLTHCHHGMLLVCQRCGAVSEMHEPEIERVLLDKIKRSGYRLSNDAAELKVFARTVRLQRRWRRAKLCLMIRMGAAQALQAATAITMIILTTSLGRAVVASNQPDLLDQISVNLTKGAGHA